MFGFRAAPEAKFWRKLWSVQITLAGAAFTGLGSIMGAFGGLQFVQDHPLIFAGITAGIFMAAAGARLLDQSYVRMDQDPS